MDLESEIRNPSSKQLAALDVPFGRSFVHTSLRARRVPSTAKKRRRPGKPGAPESLSHFDDGSGRVRTLRPLVLRAWRPDVGREARSCLGKRMPSRDHDADRFVVRGACVLLHMIALKAGCPRNGRGHPFQGTLNASGFRFVCCCTRTTCGALRQAVPGNRVPVTRHGASQGVSFGNTDQAIAFRAMKVLALPASTVTSQPR